MKNFTSLFLKYNLAVLVLLFSLSAQAQSTANYNISVTTIWNSMQHSSVPGNAHWSNLIGATHNTPNEFVSLGTNATTGIKDVAERGNNDEFIIEINNVIDAVPPRADQLLRDDFSPFAGNDSVAGFTNITVSEDFPLITLVSMVAPSPDWFIAVNSLNLRSGDNSNNGWKETFTMDVFVYDAGTDGGANYGSSDNPISPVAVSMLNSSPVGGNKMAEITFTLNSTTLGLEDEFLDINSFQLSPNPSKGVFNIATSTTNTIKEAVVYDILGKQVYALRNTQKEENITLNLTALNKGVYLLKTLLENNVTSTKKIVIN
ncbi:T9SS type A sorting domain-containing protein [Ichthyenterobacterium magnum]|uniref:Putative secreted protein (Por secretion system target) n=1 Tax=Ichthyenterobacterium magnum TaxID=1230530 RepID=A0A420DGJ0_9FLAO|nr:spondin domain-containing protein [Ichthyenterobacterium magnum]RKE92189.1 putative secreted protein (Por secretion system target) [Ichthyenterobacterium magnum]